MIILCNSGEGGHMLNNQWLNTFKTLIDVGHFTLTAKALNMTQPGVSQHVKKLEEACGCDLIKRVKKSFELTDKGRLVYEYATSLVAREFSLLESLKFDDPYRGKCSFSCSGSLALKLYPEIINLQKDNVDLFIHLEAAPNYKILKDIEAGIIDLGIVTNSPMRNLFEFNKIGEESLCLIIPKKYKAQRLTSKVLNECGLVDHPDAKMYLSLFFEKCGNAELKSMNIEDIPVVSYVNQLGQIPVSVSKGIGFTIIPQSALESFGKKNMYTIYKPKRQVIEELFLVKKKSRDLPSRYKMLSEFISINLN